MIQITSRLALEPLAQKHAEELYACIADSRDGLENLVWAKTATLESTRAFIESPARGTRNVIRVKGERELKIAGMVEMWQPDEDGFITMGYWLSKEFRGYGIMHLIIKRMVEGVVKIAPIKAKIRKHNYKSRRILEGAGLKPYGMNSDWVWLMRPMEGLENV